MYLCTCCVLSFFCFFFFKQKTAYEMRISDWSSDVCSSDLCLQLAIELRQGIEDDLVDHGLNRFPVLIRVVHEGPGNGIGERRGGTDHGVHTVRHLALPEIGRASCRERVCQYV